MGTLISDYDAEIATIVLKKKGTVGTTLTLYVSTEYWAADALYSGSPAVYPVLQSFPQNKRGVGNTTAIRYDVALEIDTKSPMSEYGKGFVDYLEDYDAHGAAVTLYYYSKPCNGAGTNGSDNVRQTLEVVDLDYDEGGDTLKLNCRDTWFKDQEFSRDFASGDFGTGLTDVANQWIGERKPISFGNATDGNGVYVSSCPIIYSALTADAYGTRQVVRVYLSLTSTSLGGYVYNATTAYVKNPFSQISNKLWFKLDIDSTSRGAAPVPQGGPTTLVSGTWFSMRQWRFARRFDPPTGYATLISGCTVRLRKVGTPALGAGQLQIRVVEAYNTSGVGWATYGSTLATAQADHTAIGAGATDVQFYFPKPLILPGDGHKYFFICEYTNNTDAANTIEITYDGTMVTDPVYTNDQTVNKDGWVETAAQPQIQIWGYTQSGGVAGLTSGNYINWYYPLEALQLGTMPFTFSDVDFKMGTSALLDTVGGDYTGTGFAAVDSPADIVRCALQDPYIGANVAVGSIDTASFTTARATLGSNYDMSFCHESDMNVSQLIEKVCRQGRLILYKLRNGKLAVYAPTYVGVGTSVIDEGYHHGDMQLINVADIDYDQIVNYLEAVYDYDALQQNTDPALLRISRDTKYLGLEYTYTGDMGFSTYDARRVTQAYTSYSIYGNRPLLLRCDCHRNVGPVRRVLDYLGDRYAFPQKRVAVKVLRSKWYTTIDLFSTIRVEHTGIQCKAGSAYTLRVHTGGTPLTAYLNGIPLNTWVGGVLTVQIQEIAEEGPWMTLIGEVQNVF